MGWVGGCHYQLDLSKNAIGASGMQSLASVLAASDCSIRTLGLARCNMREDGCRLIATALSVNRSLQWLNLEKNMMGDRGCFALADALAANDSLLTLELQVSSSYHLALLGGGLIRRLKPRVVWVRRNRNTESQLQAALSSRALCEWQ